MSDDTDTSNDTDASNKTTNIPNERESGVSRRNFISGSVAGATAAALGAQLLSQTTTAATNGLPMRPLGKTGEQVSILCLGGWHIGAAAKETEKEAIRMMHAAIDGGMTFFDNAWDYHDGGSETVMGKALGPSHRDKVFLMTKGCDRDYDGAMRCIDDSLRRLRTDHIDLWQFHEIIYENDPDWVFEKGGIKAAVDAQKAGKIRHIGFTGHRDPRVHKLMLAKPFEWATVQMPINVMDAHFRSFQREIVPLCLERGAGVLGMKSLGGGIIPTEAGIPAADCIRYALSQPVSSLVVGLLTMDDLKKNIETARGFSAMGSAEQTKLLAQVQAVAGDGRFELYKTTMRMDGPYHAKQHGFEVV